MDHSRSVRKKIVGSSGHEKVYPQRGKTRNWSLTGGSTTLRNIGNCVYSGVKPDYRQCAMSQIGKRLCLVINSWFVLLTDDEPQAGC
ncbi:hypothetical protein TNCV_4090901 [Trichonephila clavipes]|nr:hypothetical protein TNCV_4090901 [Trichonephila clavipes]